MSARAEQLVLEYLSRAADAAQGVLRPDERLRFITRLRASIDRQRQAAGAHELGQVRRVLAKFGEPKSLVEHERRRLDAANAAAGDANAAARVQPAVPARERPADAARVRPAGQARVRPLITSRGGPGTTPPPVRAEIAAHRQPGSEPVRARRLAQVDQVTGEAARRPPQAALPPVDLVRLVRRFRREALTLALVGPGALVLPNPLWLIGAVIGLTSWVWSVKDKSIGLAGPFLVTVAGVGLIGALNKNPSIPFDRHAYVSAAHADAGILIRVSAVLGALYLGARLVHRYRVTARRSANR